jgi:SAM-dependent methyltransferase
MREAYARGANAMEVAREYLGSAENTALATEISYDLQAGQYLKASYEDPGSHQAWITQLGGVLDPFLMPGASILEVGCGDGTTLSGVLDILPDSDRATFAVDLSWSRCHVAKRHLESLGRRVSVAAGDMFRLPFPDDSIDVVFTSHAIEPNGGRDDEALAELLRVTHRYVVLFEPLYEMADAAAQDRMRFHGYVRRLLSAAKAVDADLVEAKLLDFSPNPQNPSGLIVLARGRRSVGNPADGGVSRPGFACPLTFTPLAEAPGCLYSASAGIAYPMMVDVPVLRPEYAVVATALCEQSTGRG